MKKLFLTFLFVLTITSVKTFSQGFAPPEPIKSSFLDAISGSWESDSYTMMGEKMKDEVNQGMILNGQFFEVNVNGQSEKGFKYTGKGIFAPSTDGNMQGWFYDCFGKSAISTYTGSVKNNILYLTGNSAYGTESRIISVDGDVMKHTVTFTMKDPNGKEMPPETVVINYHKKM